MIWRNSYLSSLLLLLVLGAPLVSVAEPQKVGGAEKSTSGSFSLDRVIAPVLKNMAYPENRAKIEGVKMAIASPSDKAQEHVKQGFAMVHAQWDFEAYRHFCAALEEDPDCLMAYCGVALALAKPYGEYEAYKKAAVERMLDLMEADKKREQAGEVSRFPKMEKEFAAAVATLISAGPGPARALFFKVSEQYPNFLQAKLLGLFLSRDGYDAEGDPKPAQLAVVKELHRYLEKYPDNAMVIGFWLAINAEAAISQETVKKDFLPYAQKLVAINSEVPSWQHTLGYYAVRAGDYDLAEKSFAKAAALYEAWMKGERVSLNDCPGYVKARCSLANTFYHHGKFDEAMKVANSLRKVKLDPARVSSDGNVILMWRAYTLPARLYAARGLAGDFKKALRSLPKKKELAPFVSDKKQPTLAGVYVDALSMYLGARRAIVANDLKAATSLQRTAFRKHATALGQMSRVARVMPDYSHYLRAVNSLSVYDSELGGLIALAGPANLRVVASGRFLAAKDKQRIPSMMMPMLVVQLMENRLGEYYMGAGDYQSALEAFEAGVKMMPQNVISVRGIKMAREALKKEKLDPFVD